VEDWMQTEIEKLIGEYGTVPPLWIRYPDVHPYSIHWRMGAGESYGMLWSAWWETHNGSEEERIAYFRRFPPPPMWLTGMMDALWDLEPWEAEEFDYTPYFEKVEQLGFGTRAEYERDIDDPKWLDDSLPDG